MVCQKVHKQGRIRVMVTIQSPVLTSLLFVKRCRHRCRKHFHFFGGGQRNIQCDAEICAACMNINKVSKVKYWEGPGPPFPPPPPFPVPTPMVGMDEAFYIYHHLFFLVCVLFGTPFLQLLSFLIYVVICL